MEANSEMVCPPLHTSPCKYELKKQTVQTKHYRLLQKLRSEYHIDVDELSNSTVDRMINQMKLMEKQKLRQEKDKTERRLKFLNKLVQEDKYKRKILVLRSGSDVRKKAEKVKRGFTANVDDSDIPRESGSHSIIPLTPDKSIAGMEKENQDDMTRNETLIAKEEVFNLGETVPVVQQNGDRLDELEPTKSGSRTVPETILGSEFSKIMKEASKSDNTTGLNLDDLIESQLICTPDTIIFENCEKNKTYVQIYKLTNIGLEVIHVRYVGIELEDKDHDLRVPIRVEVHDNHLLRPGLSFTAKIRLFSLSDIPEIHCFLLYETRKKKYSNRYFYFRIPVMCLPPRSIVEVSPTVIRFPTVTWCLATGPERSKYMRRTLKIKNLGGKECSCAIWKYEPEAPRTPISDTNSLTIPSDIDIECPEDYELPQVFNASIILSELVDNVFETFRFSSKYHIPVPAMSTAKIDIDFFPDYRGYHHNVAYIRVEGSHICTEEKIELIGDIKKIPIHVEPSSLDMKVCTINSGVYERSFRVYNTGNCPIHIRLTVPGSMKNHCLVFPTAPIVQAGSYQTCSVRLFPSLSITQDGYRYYKEDTKLLEFPVFIRPLTSGTCRADQIKLYVFAILTNYSLELQPAEINFGHVSTSESVRTAITLTNHSIIPQEFGFLHLPLGVRIEPNFGFGVILPKETIPLYVIYSPVQDSKLPAETCFDLQVTSLAELCGFGNRAETPSGTIFNTSIWGEELIYNTAAEQTPEDILSSEKSVDIEGEVETEEDESFIDPAEELNILEEKEQKIREYLKQNTEPSLSEVYVEERANNECTGEWSTESPPRKKMQVIVCTAVVFNPMCQLSSTVIQLPATPLSSFSLTRFWLHGLSSNNADRFNSDFKTCNEFSVFELKSESPLIEVEPINGCVARGESIPITIVFRPEISKEKLQYQSRVMQAEMIFDEEVKSKDLITLQKSKSKTKNKLARQPSRCQKIEMETSDVNLSNVEVQPSALCLSERVLQKIMEPQYLKIKVQCIIKTLPLSVESFSKEFHSLLLIAPIVKPSFVYLGNSQEIDFGKVAIGDRARRILEIQNISLKRIPLHISALNPVGPFWCTTGWKMNQIDPEHIWRLPITFAPTAEKGKEVEFFEVREGSTIISFKVNGEGVTPKLTFTPDFALCLLETANDGEFEFGIENCCDIAIHLELIPHPIKKSITFKDDSAFTDTSDTSIRKTGRRTNLTAKESKKKISFKTELPPEILLQLENDFKELEDKLLGLFTVTGLDSNNELVLNPFSKRLLKIKFGLNTSNATGEHDPAAKAYSAAYSITMAKTTVLKEFTIIVRMAH